MGMTEGSSQPDDEQLSDTAWNRDRREETPLERLDRNWADLLQELRVVQTGVQLLTGFLLTIPFQTRFEDLTTAQQNIYLATLAASVVATGLLVAPVSLHRILFRRHARRATVEIAHRLALAGVSMLAVAIIGVVLLIFDVVAGPTAGWIAGAAAALLLTGLWAALPLAVRGRENRDEP
jgi:hypothetical protein